MAYCPDCGIEIKQEKRKCPLCGAALQAAAPEHLPAFPANVRAAVPGRMPWGDIRSAVLMAASGLGALAILSVLAVNLALDGRLGWARFAVAGMAAAWTLLWILLTYARRPAACLWRSAGTIAVLILLINLFAGGGGWSFMIGLPIVIAVAVSLDLTLRSWRNCPGDWPRAAAFALGGILGTCLVTDLAVAGWSGRPFVPDWSGVVALVLAPAIALLCYYRKRVRSSPALRMFFNR